MAHEGSVQRQRNRRAGRICCTCRICRYTLLSVCLKRFGPAGFSRAAEIRKCDVIRETAGNGLGAFPGLPNRVGLYLPNCASLTCSIRSRSCTRTRSRSRGCGRSRVAVTVVAVIAMVAVFAVVVGFLSFRLTGISARQPPTLAHCLTAVLAQGAGLRCSLVAQCLAWSCGSG